MDILEVLLILTAAAGFFLMVFTIVKLKMDDDKSGDDSYLETGNSIKAINTSLDEAEKAVEELNKFAQSVLTDIDTKYQELLFVYNLIDEKKSELVNMYGGGVTASIGNKQFNSSLNTGRVSMNTGGGHRITDVARPINERTAVRTPPPVAAAPDYGSAAAPAKPAAAKKERDIHPKHREIVNMHESGMSVSEISKGLDMGQGEVKLILELAKAR